MSASRTAEVHSRGWTGHIDESLSEQESGQYSQGDSIVYPLSRGLSEPDLSVQYLPCLIVCDRSVRRYLASQACYFNITKKSYAGDNKIDSGDDAPLMTLVNERRALYVLLSIQSRLRTSLEVRRPKIKQTVKDPCTFDAGLCCATIQNHEHRHYYRHRGYEVRPDADCISFGPLLLGSQRTAHEQKL